MGWVGLLVRGYDNSKAAGDKKVCPTLKGRGRNYRAGKVESGDAVTSEIVVVVQHGVEEGKNRAPNEAHSPAYHLVSPSGALIGG